MNMVTNPRDAKMFPAPNAYNPVKHSYIENRERAFPHQGYGRPYLQKVRRG